jgi:hypothetical protein
LSPTAKEEDKVVKAHDVRTHGMGELDDGSLRRLNLGPGWTQRRARLPDIGDRPPQSVPGTDSFNGIVLQTARESRLLLTCRP